MPTSSECQLIHFYYLTDNITISNDSTCVFRPIQFCANQDTSEEETANDGCCRVVGGDSDVMLCFPNALVRTAILYYAVYSLE